MKSKKIVAMVVALASFMAFATSGFAAVTTTTTYNTADGTVAIDVDVTGATTGKEVTYLVKNKKGDIVYIDQDTAESGTAEFTYKIPQEKFIDENGNVDLTTTVQLGTDGEALDTAGKDIVLNEVTDSGDNVTIRYYNDGNKTKEIEKPILGNASTDKVFVEIVAATGYKVTSISINGATSIYEEGKTIYELTGAAAAQAIAVTTEKTVVDPSVEKLPLDQSEAVKNDKWKDTVTGEEIDVTHITTLIKVVGNPSQVGVEYNGEKYPALASYDASTGKYTEVKTEGTICAVRIITKQGEATDVKEYFVE